MKTINQDLHSALLKLLSEFHRICCENNLSYIATGGTCLGAVRHNGFIPWDDDVDVCLSRAEYNSFIDLCSHGALRNGFTLQIYSLNEPHYSSPFIRLRLDNSLCIIPYHQESGWNHLGVFLDIFPYDEITLCNQSKVKQIKHKYDHIQRLINNKLSAKRSTFKSKITHFCLATISVEKLFKKQQKVISLLSKKNKAFDQMAYIDLNTPYSLERSIFPFSIFKERKLVQFEDLKIYIPEQYDAFLSIMYGDYMKIPAKEKQISHNATFVKIQ